MVMKFTHGQSCWKGPQRSATVYFECYSRNELYHVSEPSTCSYEFKFKSPLACRDEDIQKIRETNKNQFKEEL